MILEYNAAPTTVAISAVKNVLNFKVENVGKDPERKARAKVTGNAWKKANPIKVNAVANKSYYKHHKKILAKCKEKNAIPEVAAKRNEYASNYYHERKDIPEFKKKNLKKALDWQNQHPDKARARNARREASKIQATPSWLTEYQMLQIEFMYTCAAYIEWCTGQKYHVDHIIPLNGKHVRGLHVPYNLQILPAIENIKKGNRL